MSLMIPDYIFFLLLFALTMGISFLNNAYAQHKKREKAWQKNIEQQRKEQIKRLTGEE